MAERAIPIKKRQHDALVELFKQKVALESTISAKCNTVIEGSEIADDIGENTELAVIGVRAKKDRFELVLDVPVPAKPLKARRVGK